MSRRPWFPFYPEDWRHSRTVRLMPRHIRSMYLDLLGEIWMKGPIPDDKEAVANLLGEKLRGFDPAWIALRSALVEHATGLLTDRRLEEERSKADSVSEKQRSRALARWAVMPRHSSNPSRSDAISQITDHREERESTRAHAHGPSFPGFKAIWAAKTGIPFPDAQTLKQAMEHIAEYAAAKGEPFHEVADRAIDALAKVAGGWSNPQALTPDRFIRKWQDVQAVMAGTVPKSTATPQRDRNGRPEPISPARPRAADVLREQEEYRTRLDAERDEP